MDASLRMLDIDCSSLQQFDPLLPVSVDRLTILGTDRFNPELLRSVRTAFGQTSAPPPWRKIYVSRASAKGRQISNEMSLRPALEAEGFETILMEELTFEEQVCLMQETRVVVAPHGAGITNILLCAEGAQLVEMADGDFPNPNFYALACALGIGYWLLPVEAGSAPNPLDRDLTVDIDALLEIIDQLA